MCRRGTIVGIPWAMDLHTVRLYRSNSCPYEEGRLVTCRSSGGPLGLQQLSIPKRAFASGGRRQSASRLAVFGQQNLCLTRRDQARTKSKRHQKQQQGQQQ